MKIPIYTSIKTTVTVYQDGRKTKETKKVEWFFGWRKKKSVKK